MTRVFPSSRLHLGSAYYPEHWPESRWADDIRLMKEAGFTVARLVEFAWSTLEPYVVTIVTRSNQEIS